jgi:uncharacterized protein YjbI with pentapeptide repeats
MRTQFRLAAAAAALLGAVWASAAFADWPFGAVVRLEPGYGGVCEGCDLSGRLLAGARMTNGVFRDANFSRAVLARVNASGSVFEGADFSDADLSHAKLMDSKCAGADFGGAVLSYSNASSGEFTNANFTQAELEHALFLTANLAGANFHQARVRGANFSGADLRRARGLTQQQISTACGDARTRLPSGLTIPRCAM